MKTVVGGLFCHRYIRGKIGISRRHFSGGEYSGTFTENYLAADGIENVIHRVLEDMEDQESLPTSGLRS